MNLRSALVLPVILGLLAGCAPVTSIPTVETTTATTSIVTTHIAIPTRPETAIPMSPFPSSTPLSGTPTVTPTFDPSTIVTVTPAQAAVCPTITTTEPPNFDLLKPPADNPRIFMNADEKYLRFLNAYGVEPILDHFPDARRTDNRYFRYQDLTNDGVPEFIIGITAFYIFGCRDGQYETVFEIPPDGYLTPSQIFSIHDNNRNGVQEITLLTSVLSQGGHTYQIYEWNGSEFQNLLLPDMKEYPNSGEIWVEATGKIFYKDYDHDLVNEVILDSGIPTWSGYPDGLPWRNKRTHYDWNGQNYIPAHYEFSTPVFRFQAVQDGDLAVGQGEFDKALKLYQDAIFSDQLKAYSPEIRKNLQTEWFSHLGEGKTVPTPYPPDSTEYPRLAAYAYFRITLLHILQGHESDAGTVYQTLQQKFPEGNPGFPYAEMAAAFWNEYQSSRDMTAACGMAVEYAAAHSDILIPLGSDYHGMQSHTYQPEDVCPFR